jgi:hypothetical protein
VRTFRPAVFALLLASLPARAATIRVPEDQPSVLAGLDAAAAGDTVLVAPGTWTDTEVRLVLIGGEPRYVESCGFLKGGVTLLGSAGPEVTALDAGDPGGSYVWTLVFVNQAIGATIEGFTISGGSRGVVAGDSYGVELRDCILRDNRIPLENAWCPLSVYDCDFTSNAEYVWINETGSVHLERCRFYDNVAGAIGMQYVGAVTIHECEFIGHHPSSGGAVGITESSVEITGNLFLRNAISAPNSHIGGGLEITHSSGCISFNTFAHDSAIGYTNGGGVGLLYFVGDVLNNTFYACHSDDYGGGLYLAASRISFCANVFSDHTGEEAVRFTAQNIFNAGSGCNLYWNNEGGDISGGDPFPTDIWADPLYCDPENLDFTVAANSPCLPGATPGCGQIGAWGQGCGGVSIEATSWGRIKSLYR